MKSERGFTLVEMMIVVAIIAVLSAIMIGIAGTSYGANAKSFSDQVNSYVTLARTRAVAMRKLHRIEIALTSASYGTFCRGPCIILWQYSDYGMAPNTSGSCTLPNLCTWQLYSTLAIPNGVIVWNAQTALDTMTGLTPTQDTALDWLLDFRPDGSSTTGGTIFITDTGMQQNKYRVLVYPVTGSSYARQNW